MNDWKIKQWPANYRDTSQIHPICIVDSHQLDKAGKLTGRYKSMISCEAFVRANDLADQICTCVLDTNSGHRILPYLENCPTIKQPPHTLRFTFTHLGRTLNGDTSKRIESLVGDTLWSVAARTPKQGRIHRMLSSINLSAQEIGRKGTLRRLCSYRANAFSRELYKDKEVQKLHVEYGHISQVEGKEAQLELLLQCPWCKTKTDGKRMKDNVHHLHLYCDNEYITTMRNIVNNKLEDLVVEFYNLATTLKSDSQHQRDLIWEIHTFMVELPLNDYDL